MKNIFNCILLFVVGIIFLTSCQQDSTTSSNNDYASLIDSTDIKYFLTELSSDKFLGRKPCTAGEPITINFLQDEFKKMGLQPGNGNSYFQEVPLVEITGTSQGNTKIKGGKQNLDFEFKKDIVTWSLRVQDEIALKESELVFCGFGIVAPEYGWNDYAEIDMKGKTAVIFVNDPGYYSEDSTFFKGKMMTYYGRWTYKFEEAARQGADGAIIIHETGAAGYPWFVVSSSWTGGQLHLQSPDDNMSRCEMEGWITFDAAKKLFSNSKSINANGLLQQASKKRFKPIPLGMTISSAMKNSFVKSTSNNVIATLPGSKKPEEYVLYSSHWDHLGISEPVAGDSIYNGAMDNASGTATFLSIAKAFSQVKEKPERTVIFLAVTAEEQGLLGSEWYAQNPIFPIEKTVGNINMDGASIHGRMKDLTITGFGHSTMDELATTAAQQQDRYILPDQEPEKGYFFRSDHFSFAKVGVPALYAKGSYDHRAKGKEYAMTKRHEYTTANYHRPSDHYTDDWQLDGTVEDGQLFFNVGYRLATEKIYPEWKDGSEFKNARKLKD